MAYFARAQNPYPSVQTDFGAIKLMFDSDDNIVRALILVRFLTPGGKWRPSMMGKAVKYKRANIN